MSGQDQEKMIRFIDSSYNTLFYVPDGGNVVLTYSDGEKAVRPCKFLDEYHTQVGHNVYHICQFAEIMERNGTSYVPEQAPKLPEVCYGTLPLNGELILIKRGEKGYHKCSNSAPHREQNEMTAAQNNRRLGVTPQQSAGELSVTYQYSTGMPFASPERHLRSLPSTTATSRTLSAEKRLIFLSPEITVSPTPLYAAAYSEGKVSSTR